MNLKGFYKDKKVFITGHTGFKGAWLAFWLAELGAKVTGYALAPEYDNSCYQNLNLEMSINNNIANITDLTKLTTALQASEADIVFHLAAQSLVQRSYEEPVLTFDTNVIGSLNLLEAIRHTPTVRALVYITSDKCYWNEEWVYGYRETDTLGGADPYSASKACAELIFKSYYLSYFKEKNCHFGCCSARAGNVIGGGDRAANRIVPDIIKAIENNQEIVLRNPQATRPWQHVLDPLHGYLTLAAKLYTEPQKYSGESWNFGPDGSAIKTVLELTNLIVSHWDNITVKIIENNQFYESKLLHLAIDKAKTKLQWHPRHNFAQAVEKTAIWYKKYQNGENCLEITSEQIYDFMGKI